MYEFHGWFGLSETADESDIGGLEAKVEQLKARIRGLAWQMALADVVVLNGQYFLTMTGCMNHMWSETREVDEILEFVAERLPGSWGLLYERSDDMKVPPGSNAFRVRVLARGSVRTQLDPFLSPCIPNIED